MYLLRRLPNIFCLQNRMRNSNEIEHPKKSCFGHPRKEEDSHRKKQKKNKTHKKQKKKKSKTMRKQRKTKKKQKKKKKKRTKK